MTARVQWLAMAAVVVVALFVGGRGDGTPATPAERTDRIAKTVRCPTCEGLSVAESDAPASRAIRDDIARRIEEGQTDGEIRAFLVSRYGRDVLLKPESRGVAGLVWALPVAGGVLALAGLVAAFRRWGRRVALDPTDEDQVLVARARLGFGAAESADEHRGPVDREPGRASAEDRVPGARERLGPGAVDPGSDGR